MTQVAPIIVTAMMERDAQAWFDRQRAEYFPIERNYLPAHLTMFHHLPPSLAPEIKQRLASIAETGAMPARVTGLISLGRGVAYRIESPALEEARQYLAELWLPVLTPQDLAWRAHVTIQNKVTPEEAKALLYRLKPRFEPLAISITGFASWWYRGGPWEKLSRHMCA